MGTNRATENARATRDDTDLVIVSDLHLSFGADAGPGHPGYLETFFNDAPFARFLDYFHQRAASQGRPWRLVILGDFVDFLRAGVRSSPGEASECQAWSTEALSGMAKGHPGVFQALARCLVAGVPIEIVIGNHDRELAFPVVQDRLRELLAQAGAGSAVDALSFHPWIYYLPGLVYAEHGHQHDGLNAFSTQLDPCIGEGSRLVEQTVGTTTYQSMLELLEANDPCPDHADSPLRYFRHALRRRPRLVLTGFSLEIGLGRAVLERARSLSGRARVERRQHYHEGMRASPPADIALSPEVLVALDQLSSASTSPLALLAKRVAEATSRGVVPFALLAAVSLLGSRYQRRPSVRLGAAAATVALARPKRSEPTGRQSHYMQKAAVKIHELLVSHGQQVPAYVFGHNHAAQHLPLDVGRHAPQYLNCGTWSCLVPALADPLRFLRPTFVHIEVTPGQAPVPRVLAWNDAAGTSETLRFQA